MVSRDAGLFEKAAVRIVQIEEVLPIGFFDRKTRDLLLIEELIEFLYHFLTHLETSPIAGPIAHRISFRFEP